MKPFGAVMAFTHDRNAALHAAYRRLVADTPFICVPDIARALVDSPSPRFWVSEERAATVVSALIHGRPSALDGMRGPKREMFAEIHRRVVALMHASPALDFRQAVSDVIHSPAPKFYMAPRSAVEIILKLRRNARKRL